MRRGGLRPALYAYGRAHKARDPCARRPSPSPAHKGRGHGRRGPRPLSPQGDAGPPPASASAPPPHGGHPAARPPYGGTFGGAGAQRPHFAAPHAVVGALRVAVFSQLPPAPRPLGRGGHEVTTACGRGRGLLTSACVLLQARPLPRRQSDALGIQGKWVSARRHAHPLDKPLGIW